MFLISIVYVPKENFCKIEKIGWRGGAKGQEIRKTYICTKHRARIIFQFAQSIEQMEIFNSPKTHDKWIFSICSQQMTKDSRKTMHLKKSIQCNYIPSSKHNRCMTINVLLTRLEYKIGLLGNRIVDECEVFFGLITSSNLVNIFEML